MPVVDECAQRVAGSIFERDLACFKLQSFAHDVDKLRDYHYLFEPIRYMIGDLTSVVSSPLKRLLAYISVAWASVKYYGLSEKYGMESNFFHGAI